MAWGALNPIGGGCLASSSSSSQHAWFPACVAFCKGRAHRSSPALPLLKGMKGAQGVLIEPLSRDACIGRTCVGPSLLKSTLLRDPDAFAAGPQSKAFPSSVRTHGIMEVYSLVGDEVSPPEPATATAASQQLLGCSSIATRYSNTWRHAAH